MRPRLIAPLPPAYNDAPLQAALQAAGYQVKQSDKAPLYHKTIQLLGGFESMRWLFDEAMLRLCFDAQIRAGRAYTLAELKSIAQPQQQINQFYDHLHTLLVQGVFSRGYNLTCPLCGSDGWYKTVTEKMNCQGCDASFQPPLDLTFAFKPNALFTKALKNGAVTVLLFLHQMRSVSDHFLWGSYQVSKGGQTTELDLVTLLGDVVTVVECKDGFLASETEKVMAQLERNLQVADDLHADAFLFATLKTEIPTPLTQRFQQDTTGMLLRLMGREALLGSLKYWDR